MFLLFTVKIHPLTLTLSLFAKAQISPSLPNPKHLPLCQSKAQISPPLPKQSPNISPFTKAKPKHLPLYQRGPGGFSQPARVTNHASILFSWEERV
jgi:hypothetical protein